MSNDDKDQKDEKKDDSDTAGTQAVDAAEGDAPELNNPGAQPGLLSTPSDAEEAADEPAPARPGGRLVAWLALLLAAGSLGLAGWLYQERPGDDGALQSRLAAVETSAARERDQIEARFEARLEDIAAQRQALEQEFRRDLGQQVRELERARQEEIRSLSAILQSQREQLVTLSSTDRSDWTLAEAEYLVRLAHQRLLMAGDIDSALALLASADGLLVELDDTTLLPVRSALAGDMAALRAVPELDVDGTWLRLRALAGQVDRLVLFRLPGGETAETTLAPDAAWDERLQAGFRAALDKLSSYVVIRRRDVPLEALMDPQWERLVRQNLRMMLQQAQTALLTENETLYRASISGAERWVSEFFAFDERATAAMLEELAALRELPIAREYPDINASVGAIRTAVDARHLGDN